MTNIVKLPDFKPHYTAQEAALIVNEVNEGNPFASVLFREAFLHTDLPLAFNAVSNKELVGQYPVAESVWSQIARRTVLKDLTPQAYIEVWPVLNGAKTEGGKARIPNKAPLVGPNNEYPTASLDESSVSMKLDKYGLRLPFTIEMVINDQLGILENYPQALAVFMRQLEDIVVAEALINPNRDGALTSLTRVTGNPVLSIDSLSAALEQLGNVEVHGVRTGISRAALVVPRTLEIAAKRIVSIQTYDYVENGKTFKNVANPAAGLKVVVLDPLTDVNVNAKAGATWYLLGNADQLVGRPALAAAFLRGRETPQTFISSPNALTPAGGLANWKEGSFTNDSIEFKIRHFFGSALVFSEGVLVSEPSA